MSPRMVKFGLIGFVVPAIAAAIILSLTLIGDDPEGVAGHPDRPFDPVASDSSTLGIIVGATILSGTVGGIASTIVARLMDRAGSRS